MFNKPTSNYLQTLPPAALTKSLGRFIEQMLMLSSGIRCDQEI